MLQSLDFTITQYSNLIKALLQQSFSFHTVNKSIEFAPTGRNVILRHDVDKCPENSLRIAKIENQLGVLGTYYFRTVPASYNESIIKQIHFLGHEIGYHYEDLSFIARKHKEIKEEKKLIDLALKNFLLNLEKIRRIVPVNTICMHGSPMSIWDSRLMWKYYNYHNYGIVGEPYFEFDFQKILYLTDTGRRWDGNSFNIRDKTNFFIRDKNSYNQHASKKSITPLIAGNEYHSTLDIINAAKEDNLPNRIMITVHPQRWSNEPVSWIHEFIWQKIKNLPKYFIVKLNQNHVTG